MLLAFALGAGAGQTFAQCLEVQELMASDQEAGDRFGISASVSGETAILGAVGDDCGGASINCGAAYVFRFNGTTWVEEQKLTASDAAPGDTFGFSVALSGNTIVIGAEANDCAEDVNCGSAYVFRFNGTSWIEEQQLTASDAATGIDDQFGFSVSISEGTIFVGAQRDDCAAGNQCGSAYVFRFDGAAWVEEQKLIASDASDGDLFGHSVSVSGNVAFVGASTVDCALGLECGAAYVFRFNGTTWVEEQKLAASDAAPGDAFGASGSVSGGRVVVGARGVDCVAGCNCGAAYVFRHNGTAWVQSQKLTASNAADGGTFGASVSVNGDNILLGAEGNACGVAGPGSAYVYRCEPPSLVPATSSWGLISLTLLFLSVGTIVIRRIATSSDSEGHPIGTR